jgi:hypothetical protein
MSDHIHSKVICPKCEAEYCRKCRGTRCPKGHAYYGEVFQARMDTERATSAEFRYKPTTKTLTFTVLVRTTEFEVLADAVCGTIDEALREHDVKVTRQTRARVDGKLVDFRQKISRKRAR